MPGLSEHTLGTLRTFFNDLQEKLEQAELKHDWKDRWQTDDIDTILDSLYKHLDKGDPLDVAIYCMFLHARGAKTN